MSSRFNSSNTSITAFADFRKDYHFITADISFTGDLGEQCAEGYHFCKFNVTAVDDGTVWLYYQLENEDGSDVYLHVDKNLTEDEKIFFHALVNKWEVEHAN